MFLLKTIFFLNHSLSRSRPGSINDKNPCSFQNDLNGGSNIVISKRWAPITTTTKGGPIPCLQLQKVTHFIIPEGGLHIYNHKRYAHIANHMKVGPCFTLPWGVRDEWSALLSSGGARICFEEGEVFGGFTENAFP